MNKLIRINESDNVAVTLAEIAAGDFGNIPAGHKIALRDIKKGESVIKYGFPIGKALCDIPEGSHVHSHNLGTGLSGENEYSYSGGVTYTPGECTESFMGYLRGNGRAGTRNEIWIIPTVGCADSAAAELAKRGNELYGELTDGVRAFSHPYGCSQLGEDNENTARCLAALANHPNAGGVLLLSLGCENNNLSHMKKLLDFPTERIKTLVMQDEEDETAAGLELIKELSVLAGSCKREKLPASKLVIGMKCGGSDAFSGISANPLCGKIADRHAGAGGAVILTEVPEMFGAETLLMDRSVNKDVFTRTVKMINSFKEYFTAHNEPIYENPSPGNREGGITTLEEKSLGCITKGGTVPVTDVLGLYEQVKESGLTLLWGPGNDIVSSGNLMCAGANIILFTTGRGTPLGSFVPTIKLSTNTALFNKKKNWIDFDAGSIVTDGDFPNAEKMLWDLILRVAGGEQTLNEKHGVRDFAIFKTGVTL